MHDPLLRPSMETFCHTLNIAYFKSSIENNVFIKIIITSFCLEANQTQS